MTRMRICLAAAGFALWAGAALGQSDRGRLDPRDIIRSADDNGDGWIEQSELGQRSGYYVRRAAERLGLDPNSKLAVDKILPALEAMKNEESGGSQGNSSGSSSGSSSISSSSRPAAPPNGPQGFGAPAAAAGSAASTKVPGFDVPLSASAGGSLEKKFDARVIEYVNEMIRERDANKNGILEKAEWTGRWSTPPEESDLNKDNVLDKEELCVRMAKRFGIGSSGGSSGNAVTITSPGSPPGPGSFGSSGSGSGDSSRLRGYADSLIKQYDKSKNGMLEKDEWKEMRSEHQSSDVNKDGVITIDELAAHLQGYSGGGSPGSPPAGPFGGGSGGSGGPGGPPGSSGSSSSSSRWGDRWGSRSSGSGDKKTAADTKKSYRFLSPTERLPKGMPDWFLRGDADGDGQVSMVEYSAAWSEQVAAEFQKYDLDADGVITPEECQKVDSTKSLKK